MSRKCLLLLALAASIYAAVVIIEIPDHDATQIQMLYAVDGDTITLADGRRVRLVGYDTYELSEPLGPPARTALESLCRGAAYLDVDNYEPFDNYGRVLGYLWCPKTGENRTWHVSVQKYFIAGEGARYVKRLLYIPPDEHPYTVWTARHVVAFSRPVEIYVYNDTKSPHRLYIDRLMLTSGVYEIYYDGRHVATLNLISETPQTVHIELQEEATPPPAATTTVTKTVATTKTTTATTTKTEKTTITQATAVTTTTYLTVPYTTTVTKTRTVTTTVPVADPIQTYVIFALLAAVLTLAAYVIYTSSRRK